MIDDAVKCGKAAGKPGRAHGLRRALNGGVRCVEYVGPGMPSCWYTSPLNGALAARKKPLRAHVLPKSLAVSTGIGA
jgi:hypothetical protein